jgi:hypothetical protein
VKIEHMHQDLFSLSDISMPICRRGSGHRSSKTLIGLPVVVVVLCAGVRCEGGRDRGRGLGLGGL